MIHQRFSKSFYLVAAVALFLMETAIALYVTDGFVRPFLGDFLVVWLVYALLMLITPWRPIFTAGLSLFIAFVVEFGQYVGMIQFLGLQDQVWARCILGTSFSVWDLLMYTLGCVGILILESLPSHFKPLIEH
ncbi:ribosomal maturation YjgA family protein [Nonlabens xiamenensis]|uniref:ribosomal maturation YjgA family protein n=1 Tax=Nonlabens xiamenensis TaxID=2341043 RepID=UPI000F60E9E1|nr:DUF2809 domain-containing protein [Nonlabens xiamenensis]